MKTHYAEVERGNESQPFDEWGTTACRMEYYESPATNNWKYVTCKKCLKIKEKIDKYPKPVVRDYF